MRSTAAVIISIVAIVAIPGWAGSMQLDEDFIGGIPVIQGTCPPFGSTEFIMTVKGAKSTTDIGCASLDFMSKDSLVVKSFSVWFGRSQSSGAPSCHEPDLERIRFSCLIESFTPADLKNESSYIRLYGRVSQPVAKPDIRCALYRMIKNNFMDFHMAISKDGSCDGLPEMLSYPFPSGPKGSMLLQVMRPIIPALVQDAGAQNRLTNKHH